jgi:sugar transferase (PEP-CTERM/EpsH1 system associated)
MRILFLAHRLPYPPDKGDKIRSFFELEVLGARHEVDLFCFYDVAEDARYVDVLRRYCRSVYAEHRGRVASRVNAAKALFTGKPFSLGYFHSVTMAERVTQALSSNNYDLAFVFSSSMTQYVEFARIPRILDMVDVDSDKWAQYGLYLYPPKSWLWKREGQRLAAYEEKVAGEFSLTLLCTEPEADMLRRRIPTANIQVLSNRVDEAYWEPEATPVTPEIAAWQPYIIFTGSMDYLPNEDAVLQFYRECFPHLRQTAPEIRFVIAGRNPSPKVCRLVRDSAVCVTGSVPDMRPWLAGASAAVAPLRIARGIQNKVLEAMVMGVPVFANTKTAAALPSDLRERTIVEDEPAELARRLAQVLQSHRGCSGELRKAVINSLGSAASRVRLLALLSLAVNPQEADSMPVGMP